MSTVTVKSYRKEREAEIIDRLRKGLSKAGMVVARQAKKNVTAPGPSGKLNHFWHDTGELAGSIANEGGNGIFRFEENQGEMSVLVGTKLAYGLYLEVGTVRMQAYPWLFPACESTKPEIVDAIKSGGKLKEVAVVGGIR